MRINDEELRRRMTLKGYTRAAFARELGVTTTAVQKYATGRIQPSPKNLMRICELLECSADDLVEEW